MLFPKNNTYTYEQYSLKSVALSIYQVPKINKFLC